MHGTNHHESDTNCTRDTTYTATGERIGIERSSSDRYVSDYQTSRLETVSEVSHLRVPGYRKDRVLRNRSEGRPSEGRTAY